MKIAFLFAGQGSQYVGMGKAFYDAYPESKAVYDNIQLDFDVKKACFEESDIDINDTAYAQSCIVATSMAIVEAVKTYAITPAYVAGLSLGEYSALAYANAFSAQDAIAMVRKRGELMANALPKGSGKMAAVLNTDLSLIEEVCNDINSRVGVCEIANYNCPTQTVITGSAEAVDEAVIQLQEKGARRVIPLNVSGAFHSSLLENAAKELESVLDTYDMKEPSLPVVFNYSGNTSCTSIKENLMNQLHHSVKFVQSLEYMIEQGVDTFVEIGPGSALSGFVKKTNKEVKVYSIDSIESLEKLVEEVKHG